MPELPEVEVVTMSLSKLICKSNINKVIVNNRNLRYQLSNQLEKKLENNKIKYIIRRSKYIIFFLESNHCLLIHLGMSGIIFLNKNSSNKKIKTSFYYNLNIDKKHNHVLIFLDNGYTLVFNDPRRFGFMKLVKKEKLEKLRFILKLGPEPLSNHFNYLYFKKYILNKKKNIKNLLMDQKFVSGLGNIYVNEVLYLSKVNPLKTCSLLVDNQVKLLIYYTKKVLKQSIRLGGSSIMNFKNSHGKVGSFQNNFKVYGREKLKCHRKNCQDKIKKIFISNRSTFYCGKCQK